MALYTPGRRRAILILLLSSLLILTIDLRGNSILNGLRSGYTQAMRPFESASEVVSRPIRNAWRGITQYDDLEHENQRLREQIQTQQADHVVARSIIAQYYELLSYYRLETPGSYERVVAYVIGQTPNNVDQVIEINRGRNDGISVGMSVVSPSGLVGRITWTSADRSRVMLVTDTQYAVQVKVVRPAEPVTTTTTAVTTTTVPGVPPASARPVTETATSIPVIDVGQTTTTVPPTTLPDPQRETGQLVGLGPDNLPEVVFVADTPNFGTPQVSDIVSTSGGSISLAPADLPIGVVVEVRQGSPSEGLILVVRPYANLDDLEFVQVILYSSPSESASRPTTTQPG